MGRPRILFLISTLAGGIATSLAYVLPFLRERYDVRIGELLPGRSPARERIRSLGIPIDVFGKPGVDPRATVDVARAVGAFRPDVVQGLELETNFHACLTRALPGRRRVVAAFHSPVTPFRRRYRPFLQGILLTADAVVCVSEAIQASCRAAAPVHRGRSSVIPNGIPVERFRAGRESREAVHRAERPLVVGCVANFPRGRFKAQDVLLDSLARVLATRELELWLVGAGPAEPEARAHAARLGIERHVVFWGEREDVPALLAGMDLFVLPSRIEGCPLALLEAMAAGVPVIATAVGGMPEIVRHGESGLLVPPDDPDALAAAILRLAADPALAGSLGRHGRERVQDAFTDGLAARRYSDLYSALVGQALT